MVDELVRWKPKPSLSCLCNMRVQNCALTGDVGFSIQVPKLLLNLGLEEPLVHGSAQITDRGMVSVPFSGLCSFNTICMPFSLRTAS